MAASYQLLMMVSFGNGVQQAVAALRGRNFAALNTMCRASELPMPCPTAMAVWSWPMTGSVIPTGSLWLPAAASQVREGRTVDERQQPGADPTAAVP